MRPFTGKYLLPVAMSCMGYLTPVMAENIADPMKPPGGPVHDAGRQEPVDVRLQLTTTYVSKTRKYAVINATRYTEGELVSGSRILSINPGSVELDQGGKKVRLSVLPDGLIKPAQARDE